MAGGRKRTVVNNKRERVLEKEPVTPVVTEGRGRRAAPELEEPKEPQVPVTPVEQSLSKTPAGPLKKKISFSDQVSRQIVTSAPEVVQGVRRTESLTTFHLDNMKELIEFFCDAGSRNGVSFGDSLQMAQDI